MYVKCLIIGAFEKICFLCLLGSFAPKVLSLLTFV